MTRKKLSRRALLLIRRAVAKKIELWVLLLKIETELGVEMDGLEGRIGDAVAGIDRMSQLTYKGCHEIVQDWI